VIDFARIGDDIARSYERRIIEGGRENQLLILTAFLITFSIVRIITHAIRAGRWKHVLHNVVQKDGTHLHHLVPGIILLLVCGYLGVGEVVNGNWTRLVAVLFGIGAALTLDEFALWVHLEDVYWSREGRQSIDAVVIAATLVALGILGFTFWLDIARAIV
jgi:hypothetical protein